MADGKDTAGEERQGTSLILPSSAEKVNAKKIDTAPISKGAFRRKESEYGTHG